MPAPEYTREEAALHELGHAAIGCALKLGIAQIELDRFPNPRRGWCGQCLLKRKGEEFSLPRWAAFQLGGPLIQLVLNPESLGKYVAQFRPTVFKPAALRDPQLTNLLNAVGWATDLALERRELILLAPDAPYMQHAEKHRTNAKWLFAVEAACRVFLSCESIKQFVRVNQPPLAESRKLTRGTVERSFEKFAIQSEVDPLITAVKEAESQPKV